jgi:hypothetical protein
MTKLKLKMWKWLLCFADNLVLDGLVNDRTFEQRTELFEMINARLKEE